MKNTPGNRDLINDNNCSVVRKRCVCVCVGGGFSGIREWNKASSSIRLNKLNSRVVVGWGSRVTDPGTLASPALSGASSPSLRRPNQKPYIPER